MAESNNPYWSWSVSEPEVFSSSIVSDIPASVCPRSYKTKDINGKLDSKKVCIAEGDSISFGFYQESTSFFYVVGFPYDGKMYRINSVCGQYDSCSYLPGSDTLVTKQYLTNGDARSLVVYKNFSNRLTRFINTSNMMTEYDFDSSNPDYIIKDSGGYAWPVGGLGSSDNGKWLAVEFRARGIGLLNIETMQMKRVSTISFSYGTGYNPSSELAVSNDGNYISVMGLNAGFSIIDASSECGDLMMDYNMGPISASAATCKLSPINLVGFINYFFKAIHPRFSDDGGELSFYATSYVGETREVSLRAAGYGGQKLDYLALGDSFSSGEGEFSDGYYLKGTNEEFEKCHISSRSYPFLIASLSNLDLDYVRSVACSGATMGDVIGGDLSYKGQSDRLGNSGAKLSDVDVILSQTEAKSLFLPGRVHQKSFVKKYRPNIISLGIGGNDAGFMQKLQACLGFDTCNWASDPVKKEQVAVEIKNLFNAFVDTYTELHNESPSSKIYAVGYPKMISDGDGCDLLTGLLLDKTERQFMNEAINYLNQVIAAAAQKVGIKYLDIQDSYSDHALCGSDQPTAINSIKLGDDIGPIGQLDWLKFIGQESFHANPMGHYYAAESIYGSVGDILSYNYCVNDVVVCPIDISAPEPSVYWIPEAYHNYPALKLSNFVSNSSESDDDKQKLIQLPNGSLTPNSSVVIEINSTPQLLGQFIANDKGALAVIIDLPVNLSDGYHTLHIYGTSYSGESVDLYQVIKHLALPVVDVVQPQPIEIGEVIINNDLNDAINYNPVVIEPLLAMPVANIPSQFVEDRVIQTGPLESVEIEDVEIEYVKTSDISTIKQPVITETPTLSLPVATNNFKISNDDVVDVNIENSEVLKDDYVASVLPSQLQSSVLGDYVEGEKVVQNQLRNEYAKKPKEISNNDSVVLIFTVISASIFILLIIGCIYRFRA